MRKPKSTKANLNKWLADVECVVTNIASSFGDCVPFSRICSICCCYYHVTFKYHFALWYTLSKYYCTWPFMAWTLIKHGNYTFTTTQSIRKSHKSHPHNIIWLNFVHPYEKFHLYLKSILGMSLQLMINLDC